MKWITLVLALGIIAGIQAAWNIGALSFPEVLSINIVLLGAIGGAFLEDVKEAR